MSKPRNSFLHARVDPVMLKAFNRKAKRYGTASFILRELVQAFLDDRLVIQPPRNAKENLYDYRIKA